MSEENKIDEDAALLSILGGNVSEVKAALAAMSPEDLTPEVLQTLRQVEESLNPRKGVLDAIDARLNPDVANTNDKVEKPAKRTAKVVKSELEAAEDGPTDVTNAQVIARLRNELTDLQAKK